MKRLISVLMLSLLCLLSWNPQIASAYTWIDRGWTDPISMPKTLNGVLYNDYAWLNAGGGWTTMLFYNTDGDTGCTPFHNLYLGYGSWVNYGVHGTCHWLRMDCNPTFSNCTSDDYSSGTQTNDVWGGSFAGFTHSTRDVMKSKADLGDYTPYGISDQVYQAKDRNGAVKLIININPLDGGNVTGSGVSCNVDTSSICQYYFQQGSQVSLTANANCNWAFGSWDNGTTITDNPYTFNISGGQTLYAKFFRTFTNRVGNFQANIGDKIGTGECVPYVRYETDVPIYGDAYTWYQQAVSANYATNATVPRIGSVIVFAVQGSMPYGHVGIVTAINGNNLVMRSQNWHNDQKVSDDTIDVSTYTVSGYIYYTP